MSSRSQYDINVTPLIDVLLVLLIVFMVVMPVLLRIETVQIPPSTPGVDPVPPVVVHVNNDLTVAVDDDVPLASVRELAARLRTKLVLAKIVFVDFTDGVPWSEVVATVDTVRSLADDVNHDTIPIAIRMRENVP
jgi:biopolymer transport protein ExbD